MGESLPKLHSAIISRYVTAKQAASAWVRQGMRATARASAQGELDDAAKNEDEKRGGDGHVQRITHCSPGTSIAVLLS
jgi:hypothetical protein